MLSKFHYYDFLQEPQSGTSLWYEPRYRLINHITFLRGGEKGGGGLLRRGSTKKQGSSAILKSRRLCLALILCLEAKQIHLVGVCMPLCVLSSSVTRELRGQLQEWNVKEQLTFLEGWMLQLPEEKGGGTTTLRCSLYPCSKAAYQDSLQVSP